MFTHYCLHNRSIKHSFDKNIKIKTMQPKQTLCFLLILLCGFNTQAQVRQLQNEHYIETIAKVDTLVVPDRIYLTITIQEKDFKGKVSTEVLEQKMMSVLRGLGIDIENQLSLFNIKSNFRQYFLRKKDVHKSKSFSLLLYDTATAGNVLIDLEKAGISNVYLQRTEYSGLEHLKMNLRASAIKKAKSQATASVTPLEQNIGKAIYISDLKSNVERVLSGKATGVVIRGYTSGSSSLYGNRSPSANIDFDKIKIESSITVHFELL